MLCTAMDLMYDSASFLALGQDEPAKSMLTHFTYSGYYLITDFAPSGKLSDDRLFIINVLHRYSTFYLVG